MQAFNGDKLKYHRSKKMTQEELGKHLGGLRKSVISAWEHEKKPVPPKYHDTICQLLGVTLDQITYTQQSATHEYQTSTRTPEEAIIDDSQLAASEKLELLDFLKDIRHKHRLREAK